MAKRVQARRLTGREAKRERRQQRRNHRKQQQENIVELNPLYHPPHGTCPPHTIRKPFKPRNSAQEQYVNAIRSHMLTFGTGPAGTGKSYCAGAVAAEALESGRIGRIILTRPAVEAGENLGFLPGDVDDKFAVYIEAFRDILVDRLGAGPVDYALRHGRIVSAPLAFMRGKTFDRNTFVLLDEAQNTTPVQMKMFLTRIGEGSRVVINGDVAQSDIRGCNGLADAIGRVTGLPGVHVHAFRRSDIVRSGLVRALMERYESSTGT